MTLCHYIIITSVGKVQIALNLNNSVTLKLEFLKLARGNDANYNAQKMYKRVKVYCNNLVSSPLRSQLLAIHSKCTIEVFSCCWWPVFWFSG